MKLRNPFLIKLVAFLMYWVVRFWIGSLCLRYRPLGRNLDPLHPSNRSRRHIYLFWHETLLAPTYYYVHAWGSVLISQHADGELIARIARHLRHDVVRGSTTRNGTAALRQLLEVCKSHNLAITPDGPRGPRRTLQGNIPFLAAKTGRSIVPVGFAFWRPWRMKSWDRFAVPLPWSTCVAVTTPPIVVPADADREELERCRVHVEAMLRWAIEAAEQQVEGKPWPALPEMIPLRENEMKAAG